MVLCRVDKAQDAAGAGAALVSEPLRVSERQSAWESPLCGSAWQILKAECLAHCVGAGTWAAVLHERVGLQ